MDRRAKLVESDLQKIKDLYQDATGAIEAVSAVRRDFMLSLGSDGYALSDETWARADDEQKASIREMQSIISESDELLLKAKDSLQLLLSILSYMKGGKFMASIRDLRMEAGARADLTDEDVRLLEGVADLALNFPGVRSAVPDLEEMAMMADDFLKATPSAATIGGDATVQAKLEEMLNAYGEFMVAADDVKTYARIIGKAAKWLLVAGAGR
jgi:hypothetical protein